MLIRARVTLAWVYVQSADRSVQKHAASLSRVQSRSMLAPYYNCTFTQPTWPRHAAACNGVELCAFETITLVPYSNGTRKQPACPLLRRHAATWYYSGRQCSERLELAARTAARRCAMQQQVVQVIQGLSSSR